MHYQLVLLRWQPLAFIMVLRLGLILYRTIAVSGIHRLASASPFQFFFCPVVSKSPLQLAQYSLLMTLAVIPFTRNKATHGQVADW